MFKVKLGIGLAAAAGVYVAFRVVKARQAPGALTLPDQPAAPPSPPPEVETPVEEIQVEPLSGNKNGKRLMINRTGIASAIQAVQATFRTLVISASATVTLAGHLLATAITAPPGFTAEEAKAGQARYKLAAGLVGAIWASGLVGHFTKVREWPALFLYVLGTLGLTYFLGRNRGEWKANYITKENLKPALTWGGLIGTGLFLMDVGNTIGYYKKGGAPMAEMEKILVEQKFLYLFPILIVAEEFLWRGLLLSGLLSRGMSKHKAVSLTTWLYVFNHYAVAPVGFKERSMMAAMAIPIGYANGYLTLKTKNLWAGVVIHMMTMVSMSTDIFIIPKLVKPVKAVAK